MGNLLFCVKNHHHHRRLADDELLRACHHGDLSTVRRLLQDDQANVNATNDREQKTPLHWACCGGHYEICQLLILHGANVSAKESNGKTPLHWACFYHYGQLEVCRLLVAHGADVNATQQDGETPLHLACRKFGYYDYDDSVEMVQFLIDNGADVNAQDKDGLTPLHHTCVNHNHGADLETIRVLIDSGGNVHSLGLAVHLASVGTTKNQFDRMTPFHLACQNGHLDLVQLLLSRGAKVKETTLRGYTPLQLACEQEHVEVVWFLIRQCPWLVSEKKKNGQESIRDA